MEAISHVQKLQPWNASKWIAKQANSDKILTALFEMNTIHGYETFILSYINENDPRILKAIEAILAIDPEHPFANFQMARHMITNGQKREAIEHVIKSNGIETFLDYYTIDEIIEYFPIESMKNSKIIVKTEFLQKLIKMLRNNIQCSVAEGQPSPMKM